MPDIFDEVSESQSSGDVFDEIAPDDREMRRTDLGQQMLQARIEGEQGKATLGLIEGAERALEPLSPAGLLNQPARAFGYADPFQPGVPVVDIPEPSGTGVMAGLGKLGVRTLEGLTTPESIVTLPATAARAGQALFAGQMAQHLPESISQAGEVLRDPNQPLSEKIAAGGQPLVQAGMLRLAGRTPEWLPSELPKVPVKPVEAPVGAPSERPESFKIEKPLDEPVKEMTVVVDRGNRSVTKKEGDLVDLDNNDDLAFPIITTGKLTASEAKALFGKDYENGQIIVEKIAGLGSPKPGLILAEIVSDKKPSAVVDPKTPPTPATEIAAEEVSGAKLPESSKTKQPWEIGYDEFYDDVISGTPTVVTDQGKIVSGWDHGAARKKAEDSGLTISKPLGEVSGWFKFGKNWMASELDNPNIHKQLVGKAVSEGKSVPVEVISKYPDLAETSEGGTAGAFPAPPMAPIPSAEPPTVTPKAISQIIRDLSEGLGVPMRFGRLTTPKFGGYFKPRPNLIGAKYANDMPVIGHEAGHNIDTTFGFSGTPALRAELNILGDPATSGSMSSWTKSKSGAYKMGEGVAEFVRYWLIDPAHAATVAPNVSRAFETTLNSNPDFGRVMRQAQEDIRLWRTAEPEARLQSSISTSDPNNARYNISDLTRDAVDDLHYLRLAVDDAKKAGSDIPPSKDPYLNARLLRGSYGMADTFIRKGIVDFKTKDVRLGTGLEQILKPVAGRVNEFRRWIVAKQAQELHRAGKQTGLTPSDVDFVANKYDADPVFNDTFTKFKQWNDALLQYAVDGGLISPESAEGMRKMNSDYVPFHRVFEIGAGEKPSMESVGTGSGLNVGKPGSLRGRSGSRRDIVDPLETVIKNAYAVITATEKNAINTALGDMLEMKGMGKWGDRVAAPKEAVKIESERIRSQLEALGADMSMVPDDAVVQFFRQSGRPVFGENIIKVNRGGSSQYYRLRKELFDTFHALDMDAGGTLIKILSQPAQLLRAGVTLTPDFATFNAIRDTVSSAVISKYGGTPFYTTLKGLGNLLRNPQLASEWAAAGGKQAVEASYFDRAKLQKFLADKIVKDKSLGQQMAMWAKSPLTALRTFTGMLEEGTRLGQYQLAYDKLIKDGMAPGEARRLAAFEARDLQDFAKGGSKTKPVRMMTAFWNALLQANVKLASSFKNRPTQTILKGMAFVTVPKLIEQSINWNDPDYWDRPQWERDLFFLLPYGKDANGHTKFFRVPTPFEIGLIFGTFPGRVLEWAKNNKPEAVKDFPQDFARQAIPYQMVPQWVTTMLELNAGKQGYSFFRGQPIVPTSVADKPPELQFTTQNSLTARKLGGLMKMSPAKIDYAINGLTGGLGKQAVHQISDRAISAVTGEERTAKGVAPFGRFVATPAAVQSQAIEDFYEKLGEAEQDFERAKAGMATTGMRDYLQSFMAHARTLSEYRKRIREEKDETKRNELAYQMRLVAERALKQIKKD